MVGRYAKLGCSLSLAGERPDPLRNARFRWKIEEVAVDEAAC
jgi:hypothetical protein